MSTVELAPETRAWIQEQAHRTVIGVANARLRSDVDDSALIISQYCLEVMRETGIDQGTAWALLFTAAQANFTDAIIDLASRDNVSPAAELAEWAISFELALS